MSSMSKTNTFNRGVITDDGFKNRKADLIKLYFDLSEAYKLCYLGWEEALNAPDNEKIKAVFYEARERFISLNNEISKQEKQIKIGSQEDLVTNLDLHLRIHDLLSIVHAALLNFYETENENSNAYTKFKTALEKFKVAFYAQDKELADYREKLIIDHLGTTDRFFFAQFDHLVEILNNAYDTLINEHKRRIAEIKQERDVAGWFDERMFLKEYFEESQLNKSPWFSQKPKELQGLCAALSILYGSDLESINSLKGDNAKKQKYNHLDSFIGKIKRIAERIKEIRESLEEIKSESPRSINKTILLRELENLVRVFHSGYRDEGNLTSQFQSLINGFQDFTGQGQLDKEYIRIFQFENEDNVGEMPINDEGLINDLPRKLLDRAMKARKNLGAAGKKRSRHAFFLGLRRLRHFGDKERNYSYECANGHLINITIELTDKPDDTRVYLFDPNIGVDANVGIDDISSFLKITMSDLLDVNAKEENTNLIGTTMILNSIGTLDSLKLNIGQGILDELALDFLHITGGKYALKGPSRTSEPWESILWKNLPFESSYIYETLFRIRILLLAEMRNTYYGEEYEEIKEEELFPSGILSEEQKQERWEVFELLEDFREEIIAPMCNENEIDKDADFQRLMEDYKFFEQYTTDMTSLAQLVSELQDETIRNEFKQKYKYGSEFIDAVAGTIRNRADLIRQDFSHFVSREKPIELDEFYFKAKKKEFFKKGDKIYMRNKDDFKFKSKKMAKGDLSEEVLVSFNKWYIKPNAENGTDYDIRFKFRIYDMSPDFKEMAGINENNTIEKFLQDPVNRRRYLAFAAIGSRREGSEKAINGEDLLLNYNITLDYDSKKVWKDMNKSNLIRINEIIKKHKDLSSTFEVVQKEIQTYINEQMIKDHKFELINTEGLKETFTSFINEKDDKVRSYYMFDAVEQLHEKTGEEKAEIQKKLLGKYSLSEETYLRYEKGILGKQSNAVSTKTDDLLK